MQGLRAILVGAGLHGVGLSREFINRGGEVVGVVDPMSAGRPISELLTVGEPVASSSAATVVATVAELLPLVDADLALIAAPVELGELGEMSCACLDAGMDVLTIHEDAFDPPADWAELIDRHAKAGGASFLATGVQDVWWVHLPAAAIGSMSVLSAVRYRHAIDLEQASRGYGELLQLGGAPELFPPIRDEFLLTGSSILGAPLRVLARRVGLTPGEISRTVKPVIAEREMRWEVGDREIAAGTLAGFVEEASFTTDEGVDFSGTFFFCLTAPEQPYDELVLEGDPALRLEHRPFPGDRLTDTVPVARIPDLVAADPGLLSVADLSPARYRHPLSRSRVEARS